MTAPPTPSTKLLDRLLAEKRITPGQYEGALNHAQRSGDRVEEALIDTGALTEADLLKYVAGIYKTKFVSTEKLAKAEIERTTLDRVPRRLAEKLLVFPVLYDARGQTLSIVAADLEDYDGPRQVQAATGVREVKAYIGRPGAIRAAIQKHYAGDIHAFSMLDRAGLQQYQTMIDVYEQRVLSEETMSSSLVTTTLSREKTFGDGELEKAPAAAAPPPTDTASGADYVETVSVLVSLLEAGRAELRGHSAQVARVCKKVCERMGLPPREVHGILVAAHLHDVGKTSAYHLTALNVSQYEGHRTQAQKTFTTALRLFEAVHLPDAATLTLKHLYERYDGGGFPDRLSGKEIPIGARLLAIAETYSDLTSNPKNPFRAVLKPKDAIDVIAKGKGTIFDPNLVDLFSLVTLGDDLRAKLLEDRTHVLLVEPDAEETTVLELRLIEHGYDVTIARTSQDALKSAAETEPDVVIAEVDLQPVDGFALITQLRATAKLANVPFVFVTRRADRESVHRGFELGAADYLVKPASPDVIAAKVRQLLEADVRKKGGRGVSGSLSEMALPDVVQILAHGRKSGQLKIVAQGKSGEIHFLEGQIHNAMFGKARGEEAFYQMLLLKEGDFALDPAFRPTARVIHSSTEGLLLEGMRRMDEGER